MAHKVELEIGGQRLILETGRMAKQADGAVLAQSGESMVLATAVASKVKKNVNFLPLTVDYQEKMFAAGKIPGGFFKREGRPHEREILTSRLIDRPLRPLFPKGWRFETQVIASVISADQVNTTDWLAIVAASAAIAVSDIPLPEPIASVRIGRIDGRFVVNPSFEEIESCELNVVVAGTRDAIMMVEGEAVEIPEDVMLDALDLGHREIGRIIEKIDELRSAAGKEKRVVEKEEIDSKLAEAVKAEVAEPIREAVLVPNKTERQDRLRGILDAAVTKLTAQEMVSPDTGEPIPAETLKGWIAEIFESLEKHQVRRMIVEKGIRADGRGNADIRPITCEVGILPRVHGSALFTRGETQSLAAVTLGTGDDEQRIDALEGDSTKSFMLHYNFPPFSVGEVRPMRGPGRREIGHGALAERSLKPAIPSREDFPYTVRIVSDILESNGSSSMATVCGGTLALMDAGVKIKAPIAGIAMGLIKEPDRTVILSDILGLEDHLGDMDFKVTGSEKGITGLQMDIKIGGITKEIMHEALEQARVGRVHILKKMLEAIPQPRPELSSLAPRITTMHVKPSKLGAVIGPGGKVIRGIIDQTGVKIDIEDDGTIAIASTEAAAAEMAMDMIRKLVEEPEIGKIYKGRVVKIMDFGAFVEILPNVDGLCHISQLADYRVKKVDDVVKEGDEIKVKVLEIDKGGKIRLSRKEAMAESESAESKPAK
jgi:polyribonucleotide nucleotidyltransferase